MLNSTVLLAEGNYLFDGLCALLAKCVHYRMLIIWLWTSRIVTCNNPLIFHQICLAMHIDVPSIKPFYPDLVIRYTITNMVTRTIPLRYFWLQCTWYVCFAFSVSKRLSALSQELAIHLTHLIEFNKPAIRCLHSW